MLAELRLKLQTEGELDVYQSSNLHGVIMETIDTEYAEKLHGLKLNPYSQHVEKRDGLEWIITTYTKEAYDHIISPFMDDKITDFELTGRDVKVHISEKKLNIKPKKELMNKFYTEDGERTICIELLTPTSFKSNNEYLIFPDLELIYRSLMKKYSSSCDMTMDDDDTLEELVRTSRIIKYNLKSSYFPLEKVKIPGFRGDITIKITGKQTLVNYARLLFEFGEYSGIGIKCSMGMGAIKIKERSNRNDR